VKKIQPAIFLLFLAAGLCGCAGTGRVVPLNEVRDISEKQALESIATPPRRYTRRKFTYLMAWNNIPVGKITATVGDRKEYLGREVYVMRLVTESNDFLSRIYRVEDTYISYVDAETNTSLRYEADRKEGNYRKHVVVEYDAAAGEATYTNLTDGSVKKCGIEKNVQDPLSAMSYFMTLPIEPGRKVALTVNLNEKNYRLLGLIEGIDAVKLRGFDALPAFKVRPYAELKGKRVKKGKAWMYFSADSNRYPLYGVVLIPFGRVTATLRSVEEAEVEM